MISPRTRSWPTGKRLRAIAVWACVASVAAACSGGDGAPTSPSRAAAGTTTGGSGPSTSALVLAQASPTATASIDPAVAAEFEEAACALPPEVLRRMWRGYRPDRSGDVMLVTRGMNYVDGGISHATAWPYTQEVPMLWYGPGHVPPVGTVTRPVTMVDVAATIARFLRFDFEAIDGVAMEEAIAADAAEPPKLVVVLIWDSAGRNVLEQWPDAWPTLLGLMDEGAWFDRASVGSAPSVTPPSHANLGTGAYPKSHGVMDNQDRIHGMVAGAFSVGTTHLMLPTVADLYDLSTGNEAQVGIVASIDEHMGMIGHGSMWRGGDRDIAVLAASTSDEGAEAKEWNLSADLQAHFTFPQYVVDELPGLETYLPYADAFDGQIDGRWRGHDFEEVKSGFDAPSRIPYETAVVREVIEREGFGLDDIPDLLLVNYKLIDEIGHIFGMTTVEMQDSLRAQDEALEELVGFLDDQVGQGEWVLLVTADHGATPEASVSGAFNIKVREMEARLVETFGEGVFQKIRPTQVYLDHDVLAAGGHTVEDVALYLQRYTQGQAAANPDEVPPAKLDDRVFAAAFPGTMFPLLSCLPEARE